METLLNIVSRIKTPVIQSAVKEFLETRVPEYFQRIPASSSGKYHPQYCLGDGGLLRHTIAATKIMEYILSLQFIQNTFDDLQRDKMLAAVILHDTFKQGYIEGSTVYDHDIIAANEFNSFIGMPKSDIGRMIETHMGQWGTKKPRNLAEFLVHLADYLASRKDIEITMKY